MMIIASGWCNYSFITENPKVQTLVEICDNAIDDDNDGKIDLNDPDCECPGLAPASLIPNPSFEEMECCPSNRGLMTCARTWIQASAATTDYIHTCDWLGLDEYPPPMPFPDGNGIIGIFNGRFGLGNAEPGWKEYAGACLLSPLLAGVEYRFEFHLGFVDSVTSPPLEITFFGTADCSNLPFGMGDQFFGCPTNGTGWKLLASRDVESDRGWVKTHLTFSPIENIYGIAIGPPCRNSETDTSTYYYFDNLILADERAFGPRIEEINHLCSTDFRLGTEFEENLTYQWYKDGVALVNEKSHELSNIYGEGKYQVRVQGERHCILTDPYEYRIPIYFNNIERTICEGDILSFGNNELIEPGDYVETFVTADNCDSTVYLKLNVLGLDEELIHVKIFEGEVYELGNSQLNEEGEYSVILLSSMGCDSLVRVQLEYYKVYIPNIFSPNRDGVNDRFEISGPDLVSIEEFEVYDRWGSVLYSSQNHIKGGPVGWDGLHKGESLNPGVYAYMVSVRMDDNVERRLSGSIVLLR